MFRKTHSTWELIIDGYLHTYKQSGRHSKFSPNKTLGLDLHILSTIIQHIHIWASKYYVYILWDILWECVQLHSTVRLRRGVDERKKIYSIFLKKKKNLLGGQCVWAAPCSSPTENIPGTPLGWVLLFPGNVMSPYKEALLAIGS